MLSRVHVERKTKMNAFETRLRSLMDYQRFDGIAALQALIEDSLARWGAGGTALSDDDLELNAAGEPDAWRDEVDPHG